MSIKKEGCVEYPDIFRSTPPNATDAERKAIKQENEAHELVYKAVRYVLIKDFELTTAVPFEPKDFPGDLTDAQQARFAAIYGMLLADNYDSPSMGRTVPMADDLVIPRDEQKPPRQTILVANRFADAVVSAVKEFTPGAALHEKIFVFLREEGARRDAAAASNT